MSCTYGSLEAAALYFLDVIGFSIGIGFYVAGTLRDDPFPTLYGMFVKCNWFIMWVFRVYFNILLEDPRCPGVFYYAFPNPPSFYVASLATLLFTYAYFYPVRHMGSWSKVGVGLLALSVPFVLLWYQRVLFWHSAVTFGYGVVSTLLFMLVLVIYVEPVMPSLIQTAPFTWAGLTRNYYLRR